MIPQSNLLQKGWSENPDLYTAYSIAYNKSIFFTNFCGLWYPCFELPVSCALGSKARQTLSNMLLKNTNAPMIAIIFFSIFQYLMFGKKSSTYKSESYVNPVQTNGKNPEMTNC